MDSVKKKKKKNKNKNKFIRKKLYVQYHCLIEYDINNSYCHKEHHLRYSWNHLGQNRTSNKLTQAKTLIGQYCVYNIISLQDITLQITTLESRIIGGAGIIGGFDIVIIINNSGGWTGVKNSVGGFLVLLC